MKVKGGGGKKEKGGGFKDPPKKSNKGDRKESQSTVGSKRKQGGAQQRSFPSKKSRVDGKDGKKVAFKKGSRKKDAGKDGSGRPVRMKKSEHKAMVREKKGRTKKNFTEIQEIVFVWEKLRPANVSPAQKSKLVTMVLEKSKGKVAELVTNHRASRVVQFCLKHGSDVQRKDIMQEVTDNVLELSKNKYGKHLVQKLINYVPKQYRSSLVKLFNGQCMALLRHNYGADVIHDLYHVVDQNDKVGMVLECYSREVSLQRGLLFEEGNAGNGHTNNGSTDARIEAAVSGQQGRSFQDPTSLEYVLSKLDSIRRGSIMKDLTQNLNNIVEKGLLHATLVHKLLMEYLLNAPAALVEDLVRTLAEIGDGLMKMLHTKEGAAAAIMVFGYGNKKARKAAVKGFKEYVKDVVMDDWGFSVMSFALSVIDDTVMMKKVVGKELRKHLLEICKSQYGSKVVLLLINPELKRVLPPKVLDIMEVKERSVQVQKKADGGSDSEEDVGTMRVLGKSLKDQSTRRQELLESGNGSLTESILELCIHQTDEMLRGYYSEKVVVEVACGGDAVFNGLMTDDVGNVHEAIIELCKEERPKKGREVVKSRKSEGPETGVQKSVDVTEEVDNDDNDSELEEMSDSDQDDQEEQGDLEMETDEMHQGGGLGNVGHKWHILEDKFSSRGLVRLISYSKECEGGREHAKDFASTLWDEVLEGRCKDWFGSFADRVLNALLQCGVERVRESVREEMEGVVSGSLEEWSKKFELRDVDSMNIGKKQKKKKSGK